MWGQGGLQGQAHIPRHGFGDLLSRSSLVIALSLAVGSWVAPGPSCLSDRGSSTERSSSRWPPAAAARPWLQGGGSREHRKPGRGGGEGGCPPPFQSSPSAGAGELRPRSGFVSETPESGERSCRPRAHFLPGLGCQGCPGAARQHQGSPLAPPKGPLLLLHCLRDPSGWHHALS